MWDNHIDIVKKAQQRLYFLRQLRKFNLPQELLKQFYSAIIESVLCTSITDWFSSATKADLRRLRRVVRTAERIIGTTLPTLQELYSSRVSSNCTHSSRPGETHQIEKLMECIVDIKNWMTSNFLLLNSEKTEVLIIGPKTPRSNNLEHCLTLDGCSVDSSSSVRNLGVLFDSNLSFDSHVSSICKTAFFHLKNISKLRPMLSISNAEMLIHAFMTSGLDYCNALLGGCSAHLINKLQMVQFKVKVKSKSALLSVLPHVPYIHTENRNCVTLRPLVHTDNTKH